MQMLAKRGTRMLKWRKLRKHVTYHKNDKKSRIFYVRHISLELPKPLFLLFTV